MQQSLLTRGVPRGYPDAPPPRSKRGLPGAGFMSRRGLLGAALIFVSTLPLMGCDRAAGARTYQGWVEADLVFVAPDDPGRMSALLVHEGDYVEKDEPLFTVDSALQEAEVQQMNATLDNARANFDRADRLMKSGAGTQKAYDEAQKAVREAEARLSSSRARLVRRKVLSPAAGTVQQVYFRSGEVVSGLRPVVALLPPGNIKLRFYVPEASLPKLRLGQNVGVDCDGCAEGISARVSFMSASAEYTPPVIYSLEERSKLVFRVEAVTQTPDKLRVGQPVSIALQNRAREASR
jgi:HlyD family secretion protein